jgi:hypothetical protein
VTHACNSNIQEAEAGGLGVQGQPRLHRKVQSSLDYETLSQKTNFFLKKSSGMYCAFKDIFLIVGYQHNIKSVVLVKGARFPSIPLIPTDTAKIKHANKFVLKRC